MKKYNIVVLSGDEKHTELRLKKGFELFYNGSNVKKIIFNGFNTLKEHDANFDGDWQKDSRLKPHAKKIEDLIERGKAEILYARNTCENAYKLAKENNSKSYKIVTSDFHIKRCKRIFREFFHPYSTKFIGVQTAKDMKELHRLKLHEFIQVFLSNYYFHGLHGDDPEKIKDVYNKRERKIKNLIKILKNFKLKLPS